MNKVILIGYLGKNPEMRYTPSGKAVTSVSMATSERWTGANGEKQEHTEWHNLTFWGRSAEVANEYLHKGSHICVEGKIRTEKYEKDGETKYFTKIVVSEFKFLDKKGDSNDNYVSEDAGEPQSRNESELSVEEDLPF